MNSVTYRKLKGYKYDVKIPYNFQTCITNVEFDTEYLAMVGDGKLFVKVGYAWDGASGPALDTKNFIRGSLGHDALYQCFREGLIDRECWREYADRLLVEHTRQDGMSKIRCRWVYWAVRHFSKRSSYPKKNPRGQIHTVP